MFIITKYILPEGSEVSVNMPHSAIILKCGLKGVTHGYPEICIWAQVDTDDTAIEARKFLIATSKQELPNSVIPEHDEEDVFSVKEGYRYLDTLYDRNHEWHVFFRM